MEQPTYTSAQIYDSLIRQGYDKESARIMAMVVGGNRASPDQIRAGYQKLGIQGARMPSGSDGEQGSNLLTNLAEGSGAYAGYAAGQRYFRPRPDQIGFMAPAAKIGRSAMRNVVMPGAIGSAAGAVANLLSGTNYYDTATTEQLLTDMGGSVAGGIIGEKLGARYGEGVKRAITRAADGYRTGANINAGLAAKAGAKNAGSMLSKQALKGLGGRLAGRAAASGVGRVLGGTVGALGGPIGSIVLGTALGYLLPKLMPGAPKSVAEENKGHNSMWYGYEEPFQ